MFNFVLLFRNYGILLVTILLFVILAVTSCLLCYLHKGMLPDFYFCLKAIAVLPLLLC